MLASTIESRISDIGSIRPLRTLVDPGTKQSDLTVRERIASFRHTPVFLNAGDKMHEQTS
jgi:hypothetical protein